jgi:hypothetical protein
MGHKQILLNSIGLCSVGHKKFPVFDWILPFSLEHLVAWNPDFLPPCLAPTGADMHHQHHNLQE